MSQTSPGGQSWVYLDIARALEQIGDEQALRGMLPMLQELLERDLPQIEALLASQDVRGANPLLHSLKGCLPIFCGPALCEHLTQVEYMSKAGGSAEVGAAYAELGPKLQALRQEVTQYLTQADT
ncbi:MAG: Hpt domain-containing protein [Rhodoferax sp.]|nr:Hpt domain-containing protein [Rhodoferax sp.]